jgi:hypothetical protein
MGKLGDVYARNLVYFGFSCATINLLIHQEVTNAKIPVLICGYRGVCLLKFLPYAGQCAGD